jgi:hypothetical protein
MLPDPIVEEVRRAREAYAKRFNYDLNAMFDDLQRRQQESGRKTVSFPPKRPTAIANVTDGRSSFT